MGAAKCGNCPGDRASLSWVAMKAILMAVAMLMGCGTVADPVSMETESAGSKTPLCGEMSCGIVACFACPECDRGMRCYCGLSSDPGYQSTKPLECACWERVSDIPEEYSGETACSYTPNDAL